MSRSFPLIAEIEVCQSAISLEIHELERGFAEVYRTRAAARVSTRCSGSAKSGRAARRCSKLAALIALALFAGFLTWDYFGEDYLGPLAFGEAMVGFPATCWCGVVRAAGATGCSPS